MADEVITTTPGLDDNGDQDYISVIAEMKRNTVPLDDYNKLRDEKRQLINALVSGKTPEGLIPEEEPTLNPDDLRKKLFGADLDTLLNLEGIETALSLRDSLIGAGERDPFLPIGDKVQLTSDAIDTAERVATVLRECVDFAQGDSGIFTAELQRHLKDTSIPRGRR